MNSLATAQRFRSTEGGYNPPVLPTRMDFFQLLDRFMQMEAEQPFSPAQYKLYIYWLYRFNKEWWKKKSMPRSTKQVGADLSLDDKTVDAARKGLEARGLLRYEAGNKTRAAVWMINTTTELYSPEVDRKNSGQSSSDYPGMEGNFSGQFAGNTPDKAGVDRKNSGALLNSNTSSVVKTETQPSSAIATEVAHEAEQVLSADFAEEVSPPAKSNAPASHTKGGAAPALIFPAWATDTFRAEWAEWLAYRQAKRDKLKPASLQKMLDKLGAFDEGFCHQLFDKALTNGYTGLVFDDTPAKYEIYKRNQSTPFDPTHGNPQRNGYGGGHKSESLADVGAAVDSYFEAKYGS
ncbi:hypothetical protein [Hymenobacter sp. GOD-10R]|uniref:hypothetical protein n=1 Tax=Hymenobacter sp. GOD-10R TaxID=3093922 RepID=UPI002D77D8D2|nr:hypothetical protein [Hymenobacter sp. GOD-10R]WRQ26696.1 hypothetical protein SD425_16610 [Hymenobacter sp. GOD-10R]